MILPIVGSSLMGHSSDLKKEDASYFQAVAVTRIREWPGGAGDAMGRPRV